MLRHNANTQLLLPHALQRAIQSAQGGVNLQHKIIIQEYAETCSKSRTFSCDARSTGREKVKFGAVIAVGCVRRGNTQIELERKGGAVVVPESRGSSAPLANASITLAFLLASAKVTGDWPVELQAHVTTRAHGWKRNLALHLPESILVPSVPAHTVTRAGGSAMSVHD